MREFGGYLPFELKKGREFYSGEDVVALNCARNAIVYAVMDGGYSRVYIPFYMCDTVKNALVRNQIEHVVYHFDDNFEPLDVRLKKDECILYPNYFGLFSDKKIEDIIQKYENVILDNTQAFFAKPVLRAYNVYSCRKFIGVSDGAYVIHKGIKHIECERDKSYHRMQYLFKCIEEGTNEAYADNLLIEKELCKAPVQKMSLITQKLLEAADYEFIRERRIKNFEIINQFLVSHGEKPVSRNGECVPMAYPFICADLAVREQLIRHKIYVPQWWKYLLDDSRINSFEKKLAACLLPLPIDQRYEEDDIKVMLGIINSILKNKKY